MKFILHTSMMLIFMWLVTPSFGQQSGAVDLSERSGLEFWVSNDPTGWSVQDAARFLIRSPWVRYFDSLTVRSGYCISGPNHPCKFPVYPAGSLTIRWESAALVRGVLARLESQDYIQTLARLSEDYYVLAVIREWPDAEKRAVALSDHWSVDDELNLHETNAHTSSGTATPRSSAGSQVSSRMYNACRLLIPGRYEVLPARVEAGETPRKSFTLVMFPRFLELEKSVPEVEFSTRIALGMAPPRLFRAKFDLKILSQGGSL